MSVIKDLKSVGKTLNDIGKVKEYQMILESWQKLLELQEENTKLKFEIKALREKIKFSDCLEFNNNAYYLSKENGAKEGPYCPKCWDDEGKKLRMLSNPNGTSSCPKCKTCDR